MQLFLCIGFHRQIHTIVLTIEQCDIGSGGVNRPNIIIPFSLVAKLALIT